MSTLRIGIDFDNTIICYDGIFADIAIQKGWLPQGSNKSKSEVKKALLEIDGDDERWQILQSIVYGTDEILKAPFFEGVTDFLKSFKHFELYIVSHKSKYSHKDPSKNLRITAKKWMKENKITNFIAEERIFFKETRDEKVKKIAELGCDIFIDDLTEVFDEKNFPTNCAPILFNSLEKHNFIDAKNWSIISKKVQQLTNFPKEILKDLISKKIIMPNESSLLKRFGNNRIFKITNPQEEKAIIKSYSPNEVDEKKRGFKETEAHKLLERHHINCSAKLDFYSKEFNYAKFSFLEGNDLRADQINPDVKKQIADFILDLEKVFKLERENLVPTATDGKEKIEDYFLKVEERIIQISEGLNLDKELESIFSSTFKKVLTLKETLFANAKEVISKSDLDPSASFSSDQLIFSPSDFGLHNMKLHEGKVSFFDFEYFGVDDPAKLWADFYHHVGFELPKSDRLDIFKLYGESSQIIGLKERFNLVEPIIGLEWILIVLNICNKGVLERRLYATPDADKQSLANIRLQKANQMLESLQIDAVSY